MNDSRYHCKTCGDWRTYTDPPPANDSPIIFHCMNCGARGELYAGTQEIQWGPSRWTPKEKDAATYGPFSLGTWEWTILDNQGDDE